MFHYDCEVMLGDSWEQVDNYGDVVTTQISLFLHLAGWLL